MISLFVLSSILCKFKFQILFLPVKPATFSALSFMAPSLATLLTPLGMLGGGVLGLLGYMSGIALFKTFGLPTFMGALSWHVWNNNAYADWRRYALSLGLPAASIMLFACHPVGQDAFVYTAYWLIPAVTAFLIPRQPAGLFKKILIALNTTFISHAVGSLLVLYTVHTESLFWIALIPRVAIERSVSVAGMVSIAYLMERLLATRSTRVVRQYWQIN